MELIYLDNNATTKLSKKVLDVLYQELQEEPSNPSSVHCLGQKAKSRLIHARKKIASFLSVHPSEILFTSGGTESANLALFSQFSDFQGHLVTSDLEHSCVYAPALYLQKKGVDVTFLQPKEKGAVTLEMIKQAVNEKTRLIALMAVNNETGIKAEIEKIAAFAESQKIPLFIDGVAWLGKTVSKIPKGVSMMGFSGHKIHAPKGIGALFVKRGILMQPLFYGGGQEKSKRSGTENLASILAFAEAVFEIEEKSISHMQKVRDRFEELLQQQLEDIIIAGKNLERVCNTSNISFHGVDGEALLMLLDQKGICASHGSACASGALEPSRVLMNMGYSKQEASASLRFSFSRFNTLEEIEKAAKIIVEVVLSMRSYI